MYGEIIANIVVTVFLAAIVALAVIYIVKAKKSGKKCIGCPDSDACKGSGCEGGCSCCCGCSQETDK